MFPIFFAFLLILLLLCVLIAGRPDEFCVAQATTIDSPAENVFPHINHLGRWENWSPWAKLAPNARFTFEGPAEGAGAIMRWSGNKKIGEGSMTLTESNPNQWVKFKLEFLKPFKATNTAEFMLKSEASKTVVTWSMFGRNDFMSKAFSLFVNCEDRVGRDFEKGLAQLNAAVQSSAKMQQRIA